MSLQWAFNSATIMHVPWDEELRLWQEFGWRAAEIWHTKIEARVAAGVTSEQLARQMGDVGVKPIGLCAGVISTRANGGGQPAEFEVFQTRLDTAAAMGAPSVTFIIAGQAGDDLAAEYQYLAGRLYEAGELAAQRGLRLNLEFLGGKPVNGTLGSGIQLVNEANHPAVGLLFDFCHYYVSASHLEELPLLAPGKLFMVHIDDSPRLPMESLTNENRCFPGEGRIDVPGLIHHLQAMTGYNGHFVIELYDKGIWEMDPREVMRRTAQSIQTIERKLEQL